MLRMTATYMTPSGKVLTREKTVQSLSELEEKVRLMRAMGYTLMQVKVNLAGREKTLTDL
jgi:hypothetical protein